MRFLLLLLSGTLASVVIPPAVATCSPLAVCAEADADATCEPIGGSDAGCQYFGSGYGDGPTAGVMNLVWTFGSGSCLYPPTGQPAGGCGLGQEYDSPYVVCIVTDVEVIDAAAGSWPAADNDCPV